MPIRIAMLLLAISAALQSPGVSAMQQPQTEETTEAEQNESATPPAVQEQPGVQELLEVQEQPAAQEPPAAQEHPAVQEQPLDAAAPLPSSFGALRPIYFYQGQASGLVPDFFRHITIAELDSRLRSHSGMSLSAFEKPQLTRAVYVARLVDSSLVSTQSTWEISHRGDRPTRLTLGKLGVALQPSGPGGAAGGGGLAEPFPIVTDSEGNVSVFVLGDTKRTLAWTAAGRETDREVLFDLAIPKAGQTRWLIEVPQGLVVQALDGVGQALPSPPPEAGSRDVGRDTAWFAVESGGLSRVGLRILKVAPDTPQAAVAVRQAAMQYELAPSSIRFTSRLVIDPPGDGVLPPVQVSDGRITSISVDGSSASWTETAASTGRLIRIDSGRLDRTAVAGAVAGAVSITLDGEAAWEDRPGLQKLPWLQLRECMPILVGNEMQAKVLVDSRLRLPRLDLPPDWRYTSPLEADDRGATYRLGGPWVSQAPAVRAVPESGQLFAESILRLSATETRLRGVMEISIALATFGPQPIRLRVESGWTPEVVSLPQSGRVVDLPSDAAARRNVMIWPTADELKNGNLLIRVVGSQPLVSEGDWARYPSTSFLDITNCRNRCIAVVTPPPGFRWTADASLRTNRVGIDQFSPLQRELLGTMPGEAILLDISQSKVAALESQRPAAAFSVSNLMRLGVENNRLVETHIVKCESASGELSHIRIEFASGHRPDMEWSIQDKANPTRRLIRSRRLATMHAGETPLLALPGGDAADPLATLNPESAEPREIWELELERGDARSVVIVGRREYPVPPLLDRDGGILSSPLSTPFRVDLPSVSGATTRLSQVLVSSALEVRRCGEAVLRVPRLVGGDLLASDSQALEPAGTALRYDSMAMTWIEVRAVDSSAPVPVLWQESVNIVASGRGGDVISATYSVDAGSTLVIAHEPSLRLAGVTDQQGTTLDYDASASRLSIKALPSSTQVNVQWSRPGESHELWSRWTPPRIAVSGVLLRRDWQLVAAADTVIPASLAAVLQRPLRPALAVDGRLLGQRFAEPDSPGEGDVLALRLDPDAPQPLWLVDRSIGLSLVAVAGCLLFALAWWVASRSPIIVAIGFAISVLMLVGLPAGWFYWVAGVCVPIAAGALVGTTLAASGGEDRPSKPSGSAGNSAVQTAVPQSRESVDMTQTLDARDDPSSRSLLGKLGHWSLAGLSLAMSLNLAAAAGAQQSSLEQPSAPATRPTVLIPTKADGSPAGDKVYISQGFFNELFRDKAASAAPPLITSAVYRVRLEGMTESGMPSAEWEVRYSVVGLGDRSELVLPISALQVRSVQWLPEGEVKPLRWSPEGETKIRIALPPAPSAELLLRLSSEVEVPEKWVRRVRLGIPAVASASLVVDSSSAVQRFELAGALGQTTSQPEVGRLSSSLGAIKSIDLTVSLRQGSRGIPAIAARRYWVHASQDRCQVECEVDPGEEMIRRGGDVPIVILGGPPPILTTTDWLIQSAEMISPRRQLLTLRAVRDGPEPIRLLWELPSSVASSSGGEDASAVVIPDVISAGSAQTPEAWIALHAAEGLRLAPQAPSQATSYDSADAVDAFVASWKGYRGTAQQVIRSASPLARLVVSQPPSRSWKAEEIHHLHVRPGELRLTYNASITRGDRTPGPLRVTLPPRSEVREILLNGVPIAAAQQRIGNRSEIALPEPPGSDNIRLRVVAHQRVTSADPFEPPRIRIQPIRQITGSYTLTRNQMLRVEQVTGPGLVEIQTAPLDIADQLLNGWIPCWTWRIDEDADAAPPKDRPTELPGAFRIESRSPKLDVVQQTTLRWAQSRWMMDAVIRIQARAEGDESPLLDDVSIQVPAAWSDQLLVEPAEAWSSQGAIHPAMKVIRIRPDAASREAGVATIRIQGLRVGESDSLLEVPKPQLLGAASQRTYMVVPQLTAGRPLVWKAISAVADQLPESIQRPATSTAGSPPQGSPPQEGHQQVFRALNQSAAVRLEPSRSQATVARATAADIQLFPQSREYWLAIIRWDLEPGDRDRVAIRVPAGAIPIAVWTAGKPSLLKPPPTAALQSGLAVQRPTAGDASSNIIDVTLSLSRLAQPLVMLCRLPVDPAGSRPELPSLVDTAVENSWLTLYQPGPETGSSLTPRVVDEQSGWTPARPQDRLVSLARSVLRVTESSISGATDRPQEEVIAWLKSWDERLSKLRSEAHRGAAQDDAADGDSESGDDSGEAEESAASAATENDEDDVAELAGRWEPIVRAWRQYTRRVTGGEASPGGEPSPAIMPAAQWEVAFVARRSGAAEKLPMLTLHGGSARVALAINLLIGLVMAIGCALLAWRFRRLLTPLVIHPAFWLFALGLASLAVAPIPVALAICFVAGTAPLLSGRSTAATGGSKPQRDAAPRRVATRG